MSKEIIINRLLDKYESSKHLYEPGVSNRRVMLRTDPRKKEFPEYEYENATIRDSFNVAAQELAQQNLIAIQWLKGRPVLECVILNVEAVLECYKLVGRTHPKDLALEVASLVRKELEYASTEWIVAWRDDICVKAGEEFKVRQGKSWDKNFGQTFNGANVVVEADGNYKVKLTIISLDEGKEEATIELIPQ